MSTSCGLLCGRRLSVYSKLKRPFSSRDVPSPLASPLVSWEEPFSNVRINWYPGHMARATKQLRQRVQMVDMVLEVRDARIPLTSQNTTLNEILGSKPRLVVLNKSDLADRWALQRSVSILEQQGVEVLTTDLKSGKGVRSVMNWALRQRGYPRLSKVGTMALVAGIPNVGKSTLINGIRGQLRGGKSAKDYQRKIAKVGVHPGVTRHLHAFKLGDGLYGPLYMVDTPGIMVPHVESTSMGLKLGLTAAIPDKAVGEEVLADYLLAMMSALGRMKVIARALGIDDELLTHDKIDEILCPIEASNAEQVARARVLLKLFRDGKLGRLSLD